MSSYPDQTNVWPSHAFHLHIHLVVRWVTTESRVADHNAWCIARETGRIGSTQLRCDREPARRGRCLARQSISLRRPQGLSIGSSPQHRFIHSSPPTAPIGGVSTMCSRPRYLWIKLWKLWIVDYSLYQRPGARGGARGVGLARSDLARRAHLGATEIWPRSSDRHVAVALIVARLGWMAPAPQTATWPWRSSSRGSVGWPRSSDRHVAVALIVARLGWMAPAPQTATWPWRSSSRG